MTDQAAVIQVLSVARGDIRLTFEPDDLDKARDTIETMLRQGFAIFVETARGLRRVKRFNPKRMTYVITDAPSEQAVPPRIGGKGERGVAVAGSRGRLVSRGYVEIRNGPVVCKIDLDRPLDKEEMEALGPLAAAIDTVRRVIEADDSARRPGDG